MRFLPRWLKIVFWVFLGLGLTSWVVWFFSPQIKSKFLPSLHSPKIEAISDIPEFVVKKNKIRIFDKYFQEWLLLAKNKFFLKNEKIFVTPEKLTFHLINQERGGQMLDKKDQYLLSRQEWAIVEKWDDKNKNIDIFIFWGPTFFNNKYVVNGDISGLLYNTIFFNELTIFYMYDRTHSSDSFDVNFQKAREIAKMLWRMNNGRALFRLERR